MDVLGALGSALHTVVTDPGKAIRDVKDFGQRLAAASSGSSNAGSAGTATGSGATSYTSGQSTPYYGPSYSSGTTSRRTPSVTARPVPPPLPRIGGLAVAHIVQGLVGAAARGVRHPAPVAPRPGRVQSWSRPRPRRRRRTEYELGAAKFQRRLELRPSLLLPEIPRPGPSVIPLGHRLNPHPWRIGLAQWPEPRADAQRAWPLEEPPGRATIGDLRGLWGRDLVTKSVTRLAKRFQEGKLWWDTGFPGVSGPGSSYGIGQYPLPGKIGDIQRGIQDAGDKVLRKGLGLGADGVLWLDAEARHERREIDDAELNRARLGFAFSLGSKNPVAFGLSLGLGWLEQGLAAKRALEPRPESGVPRARGGRVGHGETTLVGERGPEIVQLPAGSNVVPAHRSRELLGRSAPAGAVPDGGLPGGRRELHVIQQLDGREIARSTIRNLDDDEQWGRA